MIRKQLRLKMSILMLLSIMLMVWLVPLASVQAESPLASDMKSGPVYVIPVDQEIHTGLENFMKRGFSEAERNGAVLIVLEVNTPGGRVDTATKIGDMIVNSSVPVVAYIHGDAASAGSYIAMHADNIAMSPGSMIGAAVLVDSAGDAVEDPKYVAWWKSKMRSAAELNGRNPAIAEGMMDVSLTVDMPEINKTKEPGEIISLTTDEAFKVGYADKIASNVNEVITWMGYSTADVFHLDRTPAENIAMFLTNQVVMTLLLLAGIAGVVIELIVPGFGVPGIIGIVSFGLYFFGNYVAGFAGLETGILFVVGLALLVMEVFMPSFGILGVVGSISLVAGVVRAAYDTKDAVVSLSIATAAAIVVVVIVAWIFKERGVWNRFILRDEMTTERGYSSSTTRVDLLGKKGVSLTPLRPSGAVLIDDERVDVVTEGGFIEANMPITVIKIDGSRVVVHEDKTVLL